MPPPHNPPPLIDQPIASGKFYVCIRNWIFALVMEMRKLQLDLFFTGSLVSLGSSLFTPPAPWNFLHFFCECVCWSEENGFWQLSENCLNFLHSFWFFASYSPLLLASIGFWFVHLLFGLLRSMEMQKTLR